MLYEENRYLWRGKIAETRFDRDGLADQAVFWRRFAPRLRNNPSPGRNPRDQALAFRAGRRRHLANAGSQGAGGV
jgi:hypothetical protein